MAYNHKNNNNTCNATNLNPDGGGSLLDDMNPFCTNPPTPLKPTFAFPCDVTTVAACCPACCSTTVTCASSPSPQLTTTTTTSTATITSIHGGCGHITSALPTGIESTNNRQSFDDYLDLSVQEILQEGTGAYQSNKNGATSEVLDKKISKNPSTPTTNEVVAEMSTADTIATKALPLDYNEYVSSSNQLKSIPAMTTISSVASPPLVSSPTLASSSSSSSSPLAVSGNVVRTIKLPETHIFTPNKCASPVSRDSTDRAIDVYCEPTGDTQFDTMSGKGIVVREYHDVEYSLEKNSTKIHGETIQPDEDNEFDDDFHEFQSVGSTVITNNKKPEQKEDQRVPESRRSHLDVGSEFTFGDRKETTNSYSKPVFGTSPTEELDQTDDEFSEFQAAVPVSESDKPVVNKPIASVANEQPRSNTSSPMLLCPSILLPQKAKRTEPVDSSRTTQINWPEPGIDPEELARFEAAFPKPKVAVSTTSSNNCSPKHTQVNVTATNAVDDDEWTDFVYSKPAAIEKPPVTTKPVNSTPNNQQEEWTDFIYSTPSSQSLSSSQNNFNYHNSFGASSLGGPKFNSWNQPQLPPPQFSSWNSNNYYYTPHTNNASFAKSTVPTQKVPTFSAHSQMQHSSITNNYHHQHASVGANLTNQSQRSGQPSIAGISHLPELSFITPNAPAGGNAPGVKPLTHSFLSNVISSNNFTKK
ncbi:mucin-5AC-like [Topomyia yanbarensis]|uniref:mucin-5AC-like n=1 Tax=Topomyia yanbarensis TaxID=2498891 RepID=UPI00273A9907|nr:mucin-5AC-like [Topomyia yanbarensis]